MIVNIQFDHYENDTLADLYIAATLYRRYPKFTRLPKVNNLPLNTRAKLKEYYAKFKKMSSDSFEKMIRLCVLESKTKIIITEVGRKENVDVKVDNTTELIGTYTTDQFDQYRDFYN